MNTHLIVAALLFVVVVICGFAFTCKFIGWRWALAVWSFVGCGVTASILLSVGLEQTP